MRYKLQGLTFALAVVCFLYGNACGQEREVPVGEIVTKTQKAEGWLRNIPYRSIMTLEWFSGKDGETPGKSVLIVEEEPPGRKRWRQENSGPAGFKTMDVVSIGDQHYRRFDNKAWESVSPPAYAADDSRTAQEAAERPKIRPKFSSVGKFIEQTTVNDRNLILYEVKNTTTTTTNDSGEKTRVTTRRYWLRDDGLMVKKQEELETVGEKSYSRMTIVYEYENIKVEAPIK